MSKVGIYIEHGIEFRHFIVSGLHKEFEKNGYEVVIMISESINSRYCSEFIENENLQVVRLKNSLFDTDNSKFDNRLRYIRKARRKYLKNELYSHSNKEVKFGWLSQLIGRMGIFYRIIHFFLLPRIKQSYSREGIVAFFKKLNVDRVIILEYGTSRKSLIGNSLEGSGIRIDVYLNTLKTVFINDFLSFRPDNLYCWTHEHTRIYESENWYHKPGFARAMGSPFHTFLREREENEIKALEEKYGIDKNQRLIVYSLIFEKVYSREHFIIEKIYKILEKEFTPKERPILAIRRNPFEETSEGIIYLRKKCPGLLICDHYWERNENLNWSLQGLQGEIEWRALLHRADLLLNIPSMATIDAMMTNTPTGNVYCDENDTYNHDVSHILESPFSKLFVKNPNVYEVCELNDIPKLIDKENSDFIPSVEVSALATFVE